MYSSRIASILSSYGVTRPEELAKIGDCGVFHAKQILLGRRPISKKIALRLKEFTEGALSTDFLFTVGDDGKRANRKKA